MRTCTSHRTTASVRSLAHGSFRALDLDQTSRYSPTPQIGGLNSSDREFCIPQRRLCIRSAAGHSRWRAAATIVLWGNIHRTECHSNGVLRNRVWGAHADNSPTASRMAKLDFVRFPAGKLPARADTDLVPTQMTVGMQEVEYKRRRWRERSAYEAANFLNKLRIPVVLGPGARPYLLDTIISLSHCTTKASKNCLCQSLQT